MGDVGLSFPSPSVPCAHPRHRAGGPGAAGRARQSNTALAQALICEAAREQHISSSFYKYSVITLPLWSTYPICVLYHTCDFIASN